MRGQIIIGILSGAGWFEENVLKLHDVPVRIDSGFIYTLCANLMAQQRRDNVRFDQETDTKQIMKLNDLRKEYRSEESNVSGELISS